MLDSTLQISAESAMSQGPQLPNLAKTADVNQVRKTAEDFEAVFLAQMFKPMFEGIESDGPFGGGQAENMWRSLMVEEYGKSVARAGGIGIADAVMKEMLKLQEVQ